MTQKSKTSYVVPALIYALIVGSTFSPDVQPVLTQAFGTVPSGLPIAIVVATAVAVLFLPFAYAVHHFMLLAEQALAEGRGVSKTELLSYAITVGQRRPELRRSQIIALGGLFYFVLICAAWIIYADAKGI
jgi:hypothetical protein